MFLVFNKADLRGSSDTENILTRMTDTVTKYNLEGDPDIITPHALCLNVSCAKGTGIDQLENLISDTITSMLEKGGPSSEGVLITRDRHRRHLSECVRYLDNFLSDELPMDIAAEELRCVSSVQFTF